VGGGLISIPFVRNIVCQFTGILFYFRQEFVDMVTYLPSSGSLRIRVVISLLICAVKGGDVIPLDNYSPEDWEDIAMKLEDIHQLMIRRDYNILRPVISLRSQDESVTNKLLISEKSGYDAAVATDEAVKSSPFFTTQLDDMMSHTRALQAYSFLQPTIDEDLKGNRAHSNIDLSAVIRFK